MQFNHALARIRNILLFTAVPPPPQNPLLAMLSNIQHCIFSHRWSFGVLLWEIVSLGMYASMHTYALLPHAEISNK